MMVALAAVVAAVNSVVPPALLVMLALPAVAVSVPTMGTPAAARSRARPSGVWPPSCTMTPATGPAACSAATTSSTSSRVSGSKYSRPEVS